MLEAAVGGLLAGCAAREAPTTKPEGSIEIAERVVAAPPTESSSVATSPIGSAQVRRVAGSVDGREANCCKGKNDCKGLGGCKSERNTCAGRNDCKALGGCNSRACESERPTEACCKGMNECKGKGMCKTETHACKGMNACKGKGGCKPSTC